MDRRNGVLQTRDAHQRRLRQASGIGDLVWLAEELHTALDSEPVHGVAEARRLVVARMWNRTTHRGVHPPRVVVPAIVCALLAGAACAALGGAPTARPVIRDERPDHEKSVAAYRREPSARVSRSAAR